MVCAWMGEGARGRPARPSGRVVRMSGLREPLCGLQAKPPSPMQVTSSDQSPPAPPTWGPLGLHTPPPMRVWVSRSTIYQKQMATVLPL